MLKYLLSSPLFLAGIAFFILISGGSLIYLRHVKQQTEIEINRSAERIKHEKPEATETGISARTPLAVDPSQEGLFHEESHWKSETDITDKPSETQENSTEDDSQDAQFQKRVEQYEKDYRLWHENYSQAYADWKQANDAFMKFRSQADEDWFESLRNLSEGELREIESKIDALLENQESARKKALALWEETPVYPTQ